MTDRQGNDQVTTDATRIKRPDQDNQVRPEPQPEQQKPKRKQPTIKNQNGEDVPFHPAPVGHASESVTRLHQRAREMASKPQGHALPASATDEAKAKAQYVPLPAGGLAQLARDRFPDDVDDQDAMDQHLYDLLTLNRDLVRDETNHTVGQHVRVPA